MKTRFVHLLCFAILSLSCFANACPEYARLAPPEHWAPTKVEKSEYLGLGQDGAVHRIYPPNGEPYILKIYNDPKKLKRDVELLSVIEAVSKDIETFKVPKFESLPPVALKLENIEGLDLHEKNYKTLGYSQALEDEKSKFRKYATNLMTALKDRGLAHKVVTLKSESAPHFFRNGLGDGTTIYGIYLDEGSMIIKSDNVILTESGELVLVDPH